MLQSIFFYLLIYLVLENHSEAEALKSNPPSSNQRRLLSSPSDVLVLGGNFTFKGDPVTLLQFDLYNEEWAEAAGPELFLYGAEGLGTVYDMAVDTTHEYNQLYVVGEFDTIYSRLIKKYFVLSLMFNRKLGWF